MSERKPPKRAIALAYDGRTAPQVTATGTNELAERIIATAIEHDVPLFEDPELAALLSRLDLGEEIPEALYRAVAQVIAFAYHVRGKTP